MASSVSVIATTNQHHMDRLDAARALLGVSPSPDNSSPPNTSRLGTAGVSFAPRVTTRTFYQQTAAQHSQESRHPPLLSSPSPTVVVAAAAPTAPAIAAASTTPSQPRTVSFESPLQQQKKQPPQVFQLAPPAVISNGLDALAALASSEQASWEQQRQQQQLLLLQQQQKRTVVSASTTGSSSSSSDDDSEAMPPPPPRPTTTTPTIPTMASAVAPSPRGGRRRSVSNPEGMEKWAPSSRRHFVLPASILEEELAEANAAMEAIERKNSLEILEEEQDETQQQQQEEELPSSSTTTTTKKERAASSTAPISGLMSEEEQANLSPEELLKRARSRLLEDLSEGSLNGEKGVLTLPHSLSKYKEVYNKNGRIGIYTPAERAAIIARFNQKRSRRVWNKKIRYNCRKNLADRRMRVKGRFVKRSTEQQAKVEDTTTAAPIKEEASTGMPDEDMPDVTDPEAGFCPTEDQPYRRTRRHTIT